MGGYAICPNAWTLDERIRAALPILLLISSLSAKEGYCYASNDYLAQKLNMCKENVSRQISKLKKLGYLSVEEERFGAVITNRKLYPISPSYSVGFAKENTQISSANNENINANDKNINPVDKNVNAQMTKKSARIDKNVNGYNRFNNTSQEYYKPNITSQEYYKPEISHARTHESESDDDFCSDELFDDEADELNEPSNQASQNERSEVSLQNERSEVSLQNEPNKISSPKEQIKQSKISQSEISLPSFISTDVWREYLAYKKERKEKLTPTGIRAKFSQWAKWASEGVDINEAILEAMANGWAGVFKPKAQSGQSLRASDTSRSGGAMSEAALRTLENARKLGEKLKAQEAIDEL